MAPLRLAALLVLSGVALATGACSTDEAALETRTFELRHLEPVGAFSIVEPYVFTDHPEAPGQIGIGEESRTLTVRERPANLDRIARVLSEHDRPASVATLRFRVVEARHEEGPTDPELAGLEATLREVLRFESYRSLGEALARVVEGGEIDQRIGGPGAHSVQGRLRTVETPSDGPTFGRLAITLWTDPQTRALETTLNVADGQTLVVGTAGNAPEGGAIILTVTAEFDG